MTDKTARLDALMRRGPVIPVVTIERVEDAVPLARALVAGGVAVIEVTLRTPAGLEAIRRIAGEVEGAVPGAGTVLDERQAEASVAAGAQFLVSPGSTVALLDAAVGLPVPMLPGIATASEAMAAMERGLRRLKFFPAEAAGGIAMLKSLHGPLGELVFCPTGGIDLAKAPGYLALPNVACVGGSWLTPAKAVAEGAWDGITELARGTAALRPA
ncbi:bifunctional 4-hydroxy-2-oxoglutarate aldolase/2-dehydro-3-deoxy-phosphogluconate aldolase [Labrys wisconsinensis]|uniref:2-dehydro-3-deoxy-phosphogluconate aldolase n=1 Tax=Labrys wisconsinensis TaxID=425677 RepID=A0ABU0JCW3_9HYPH|nr:bifunctional 4-hydroxy-2-oxoglutarate aldolase/2-dehydro-3-deoxy-phosphogluconate aldolase [Labrys wisconsinensis]MDQ0471089.1 2-dehydro-3-deoxyphosphogluconate aldolase/(4S)-4-hydroxy-2-oxoglutarate aldolase [Labrys wisconsinensis]